MITLNAHSHSISTSEITTYGVCWVRVCVNAMIGRATPGKRGSTQAGPSPAAILDKKIRGELRKTFKFNCSHDWFYERRSTGNCVGPCDMKDRWDGIDKHPLPWSVNDRRVGSMKGDPR